MITAKVVLHSKCVSTGANIWTLQLRYHRFIHPEFMTHRKFSRNASSSRAVPAKKLLAEAIHDQAMPLYWGKNQAGMQAAEELTGWRLWAVKRVWRALALVNVAAVWSLMKLGLHKQIANRPLEWATHISVVMTTTNLGHFFNLRKHPAAQPEMQALANAIYNATKDSVPQILRPGDWHLPYITPADMKALARKYVTLETLIHASAARCARVSFLNHDGSNPDLEKDLGLAHRLISSAHWSPTEHQAAASVNEKTVSGNFDGWYQFRKGHQAEFVARFKNEQVA